MAQTTSTTGFRETRWSLVLAAADPQGQSFRAALDELARSYHRPIQAWFQAFLRDSPEDAEDLTQEFLTRWTELGTGSARPEQGSFRAYLRGALRHFALNHRRRQGARRRGGDREAVALSGDHYPSNDRSPEQAFDQTWRRDLLEQGVRAMEEAYRREGRPEYSEAFRRYYQSAPGERPTHPEIAADLGVSPSALNSRLAHARARLRGYLEQLVRDSVRDQDALLREMTVLLEGEL